MGNGKTITFPAIATLAPGARQTYTVVVRAKNAGQVQFRADKAGIVHCAVGKTSFEAPALLENLAALVEAINRAKPTGAKGQYLKGLTIASTMGPGIRVDVPGVLAAAAA